jgi:methionine-rich copper-binding protein CopC
MRRLALAIAGAALLSCGAATARAMSMVDSSPAASAVIGTRSAEFFVRFDGPVDHRRSRLVVTQAGRVIETLHPRLDARPSVLFARAPGLPAGDYMLHWDVISLQGAEEAQGDIPFSVRAD